LLGVVFTTCQIELTDEEFDRDTGGAAGNGSSLDAVERA